MLEIANNEDAASEEAVSRTSYASPLQCAQVWYSEYSKKGAAADNIDGLTTKDVDEFKTLLSQGPIPGLSAIESDMLLFSAIGAIADFSECGDDVDCSFDDIAGPLALAVPCASGNPALQVTARAKTPPWSQSSCFVYVV